MQANPASRAELVTAIEAHPRLRVLYDRSTRSGSSDPAHDVSHLLRVALWTLRFGAEPFEEAVAAALLHDIVNLPKNHPERAKASEYSAEKAREWMTELGFAPDSIDRVAEAIRQHSYSRGEKPSSLLAQALQDADRLEALGAIGLMRVFSTGAKMGARYFHDCDPWARSRDLDDLSYSVDHFFTKLLRLSATMNTEKGKNEAERRTEVLRSFLTQLGHEIGEAP